MYGADADRTLARAREAGNDTFMQRMVAEYHGRNDAIARQERQREIARLERLCEADFTVWLPAALGQLCPRGSGPGRASA